MESWRMVWREGVVPLLSTESLEALRGALIYADAGLVQGVTTATSPGAWSGAAGLAARRGLCPGLLRLEGGRAGDGHRGRGISSPASAAASTSAWACRPPAGGSSTGSMTRPRTRCGACSCPR